MTVEYWPMDEYRCWNEKHRQIYDGRTMHFHCINEAEVIEAYRYAQWIASRVIHVTHLPIGHLPDTLLGAPWGVPYICISGPLGILKGIK